jgi:cytochrome c oxidase subunit 3
VGFFQQITEKPWVAGHHRVVDLHDRRAFFLPSATLGLRMLLAAMTVLFSLLVVAYADRMVLEDWRALPEPWLLWPNTAVLIVSSVSLQWASISARRREIGGIRRGLLVGGACAFLFLVGQLLAWQQLVELGYFAATNPANAFFYLLTALHGLHLLGGLVAWSWTSDKAWRRDAEVDRLRLSVELCTVYWHFLLVVWLVLFCLMLFT